MVHRPFEGLAGETDWVALREVVPAATAPLRLRDGGDRTVTLSTLLPLAWPALVRSDGTVLLGLQVQSRSGDVSRDLAAARVDVTGGEQVAHLARATAADHPGALLLVVERHAHRHDVRSPVGAQRGEGAQVSLGPELQQGLGKLTPARGPGSHGARLATCR